ncbi:MAG: cell division protein ZapA [bacterium]
MKRSYEVSILNQKFVIKSESDERYILKVADYVNKKMHDILSSAKSISTLRVAILVALNVADDYFKLREQKKESQLSVEKKLKDLVAMIDRQLQ